MSDDDPLSLPQLNSARKTDQFMYMFNMSEDVWPFIDAISDPKARQFEINENANLSDREVFSIAGQPNAIFITPKAIDQDFLNYSIEVTKAKNLQVWVPSHHSGELSKDCLNDQSLFERLVAIGKQSQRLVMVPYSTSFQFLELVAALREAGVEVYTPESPDEEHAWTVNFFGSKSGIRQLVQKSAALEPDLVVPDGLICVGQIDAARIAANKYIKEHGVVLKTNKGHSGAGVLIFREGELPSTYKACERAILQVLEKDAYWEMFPIVIESLINVNSAVGGGFPNVEFKIKRNGEIEFLFFCGLRVTSDGVFRGIEINENVINDRIEARLVDTGFFVGEQLAAAGYRGSYDVDFIVGKNNQIYVTESNVRRTGGTFLYEAALVLIGKEFMQDSYMFCESGYKLPTDRTVTFSEIKELLRPVLYNHSIKEGVVILYANLLKQHNFGYMVFGNNKKRSLMIEEEMMRLLKSVGL